MEEFNSQNEGRLYSLAQVFALVLFTLATLFLLTAGNFHNWAKTIKDEKIQGEVLKITEPVKLYFASLELDYPVNEITKTFQQFVSQGDKKAESNTDLSLLELTYEPQTDLFLQLVSLSYDSQPDPLESMNLLDLTPESNIDPTAFTILRPLKVLAIGDSLLESAYFALNQGFNQEKNIKLTLKAVISSTLIQPKYIDWPKTVSQMLAKERYDLVIVFLGTNDNQTVIEKGKPYLFKTPEWFQIQRERMLSFIKSITDTQAKVYWIGIPPVKVGWDNDNKMMMNGVYEKICQESQNTKFISTQKLVGDANGKYTQYLKINQGFQKVRIDDGYHFAYYGGKIIADYLLSEIKKDFKMN